MSQSYVIKITFPCANFGGGCLSYWISKGRTFYFNKEKYACLTGRVGDAKIYSSYQRAKNAFDKLQESCVNLDDGYCEIQRYSPIIF